MDNSHDQGQNFSYVPPHAFYTSSDAVQDHLDQQPADAYHQERARSFYDERHAELSLNFLLKDDYLASLPSNSENTIRDADFSQTNQPSGLAFTFAHAESWCTNAVDRRNVVGDGAKAGGLDLSGWPPDAASELPVVDDIVTNGQVGSPDAHEVDFSGPQVDEWGVDQPDAALGRVAGAAVAPLNLSVISVMDQQEASSGNDAIAPEEDILHTRSIVTTVPRQLANAKRRKWIGSISCSKCNGTFTRSYNLKEHMKLHDNKKKFPCTVPGCGWRFNTAGGLRSHKKNGHRFSEAQTA